MMRDRAVGPLKLASLWLPVVLWMSLIFLLSEQRNLPTPESGLLDFVIKKTGHVFEYFVLGLLLLRATDGMARLSGKALPTRPPGLVVIVIGALYAVSDELHQAVVPTRKANLSDVVIDTLAVTLAVVLVRLWQRRRARSARS